MSSDVIEDIHNLMLMSKLSEGAEVFVQGTGKTARRFVILKGMPLDFRNFVQLAACVIRGSGSPQYDKKFFEQIYELWEVLGFNRDKYNSINLITLKNTFDQAAQHYMSSLENGIDYKPLMSVVYEKFEDWEV
jgi:hypothetical protein